MKLRASHLKRLGRERWPDGSGVVAMRIPELEIDCAQLELESTIDTLRYGDALLLPGQSRATATFESHVGANLRGFLEAGLRNGAIVSVLRLRIGGRVAILRDAYLVKVTYEAGSRSGKIRVFGEVKASQLEVQG